MPTSSFVARCPAVRPSQRRDMSGIAADRRAVPRHVAQRGASDLHLSVASPPIVRKDGRMQPLTEGAEPSTADAVMSLLLPILPEQNRREFRERHDTDFAYDLKGVARFRGNVFMDRRGRARCSASSPRNHDGRAARPVAAHPAISARSPKVSCSSRDRPDPASRRRCARWWTTSTGPATITSSRSKIRSSSCTRTRSA